MKKIKYLLICTICLSLSSCSIYNFTGTGQIDAQTFQVNNFLNNAALIEPGVERIFTQKLQNLLQNQTNLNLINNNGDLFYEGEITDYRISPMAATANQTASQNRLSVTVNVRFVNRKVDKDNFEKKYTFYEDFGGDQQLTGSILEKVLNVIYERITQDIFNDSLAKW